MRYVSRCSAVAALLLLLGVSVAPAQNAQTRQGFWIGFGLGMGSLGLSCDGCDGIGRESALSGYLKMGGTISPKLLLGGETNGWTKGIDGTTVTAGNASFAAYFYPMPAGGLFLRAGLGLSTYQETGFDAETGFGGTLGAGYDIRVGNNFSITPVLNLNWGKPVTGISQNVVQFAIGGTFH
jgi:hypothetical protein